MRLLSTLVLTAILPVSCNRQNAPSQSKSEGPALSVTVKTVSFAPYVATEDVVGTVRPSKSAVIAAKVMGRVLRYLAAPGQMVKSGDLLAELDVQEIQARYEQASATLEQADREMVRYKQLIRDNAASGQDYDAAEAKQKVARAAVSEAKTMLGYARVTAPFDGVITRKLADVGDLAMPGKPLMELEAPGMLRFEADLPDAILDRVKMGAKMVVTVSSVPQPLESTVSEIAPAADAASRTFLVKLDLPQTSGLRTGQFGRVSVPVAEVRLLSVPRNAVSVRGQMELVFVCRDNHAVLRLVKTGKVLDGRVEILSGLEEGEQVIVGNVAKLTDGQPIAVRP